MHYFQLTTTVSTVYIFVKLILFTREAAVSTHSETSNPFFYYKQITEIPHKIPSLCVSFSLRIDNHD